MTSIGDVLLESISCTLLMNTSLATVSYRDAVTITQGLPCGGIRRIPSQAMNDQHRRRSAGEHFMHSFDRYFSSNGLLRDAVAITHVLPCGGILVCQHGKYKL